MTGPPLGALPDDGGVHFCVWAPEARQVDLVLETGPPASMPIPLQAGNRGYYHGYVPGLRAGALYRYRIDGGDAFPDPASRFQPEGVHGPSAVVDPGAYTWGDAAWAGIPQERLVFYELHIGTFSDEGTYAGVQKRLGYLKDLGVTALELMPVADFPGRWNWGYDHAALYAPSRAYGSPDALRALVDAAHRQGLAVYLDVIYNHLGPDGAYAAAYAPFFTDKHETPWGRALNLDDTHCEGVRHFFIHNALHWLREYHFDGLRLDAVHAILDDSTPHFLAELAEAAETVTGGPRRVLIAEDHRNVNTLVLPRDRNGYGLDGVWVDDFHHQIRNLNAGDREGYFADFAGTTAADIAETLNRTWFYDGRPGRATGRPRGTDPEGVDPEQCVYFIQNHDQVGNRPTGNRLTDDVALPVYHAASALLLISPALPLLFMGQEWAATTPFQFFTDHNPTLGRLVSEGRRREFRQFSGFEGDLPDPQDPDTFNRSRLDWSEQAFADQAGTLALYRDLLALRPRLQGAARAEAFGDRSLRLRRGDDWLLVSFTAGAALPLPDGATPVWHSEQAAYKQDPTPPDVQNGQVHFHRAGALLARTG